MKINFDPLPTSWFSKEVQKLVKSYRDRVIFKKTGKLQILRAMQNFGLGGHPYNSRLRSILNSDFKSVYMIFMEEMRRTSIFPFASRNF